MSFLQYSCSRGKSNLHLDSRSLSSDCDHCWVSSKLSLLGENVRLWLLNQKQIWVKLKMWCTTKEQWSQESIADVLIKFVRECQGHGRCWHVRLLCQGKHGVSSSFESFHDALDGNDRSKLAILKCMQKHSISLITFQSLMSVRTCTGVGT